MKTYKTPFIEWTEISFDPLENIDIENATIRAFYKSFFTTLHLPKKTLKSLFMFLIQNPV